MDKITLDTITANIDGIIAIILEAKPLIENTLKECIELNHLEKFDFRIPTENLDEADITVGVMKELMMAKCEIEYAYSLMNEIETNIEEGLRLYTDACYIGNTELIHRIIDKLNIFQGIQPNRKVVID